MLHGRRDDFALRSMLSLVDSQEAIAEQRTEVGAKQGRFLEVVVVLDKHLVGVARCIEQDDWPRTDAEDPYITTLPTRAQ